MKLKAKEILDSRNNPTVEVELEIDKGSFKASVPSGASVGKYEAKELRDREERYKGKGVLKAVNNINKIIAPKIQEMDLSNQAGIDNLMIELDGTKDKSKLGANAVLAVSIAVCRAGAVLKNIPLYQYIAQIAGRVSDSYEMPSPCFNIINGGLHAGNDLDIQEFMVVPQESSFSENLEAGKRIYDFLKMVLKKNLGERGLKIGDEGGFAPLISKTYEALDLIKQAIKNYPDTKIGLDCAGSQLFHSGKYRLDQKFFNKKELLSFYQDLIKKYPIIFIEDPFYEEDWDAFQEFTKRAGNKINIIGDDLLTTNISRMKQAQDKKACNGMILKPNQIGTVTEVLKAANLAKSYGWKIIVSHRSGETEDDFIADLSKGIGAEHIKSGAPITKERMSKYNRLKEIEQEVVRK